MKWILFKGSWYCVRIKLLKDCLKIFSVSILFSSLSQAYINNCMNFRTRSKEDWSWGNEGNLKQDVEGYSCWYFFHCSLFALRCQEFLIYIKRNCVPAYWLHDQIRLVWFVYYNTTAKVCSWNYYKKWNGMLLFTASCYVSQKLLSCVAYRFYWGIDSKPDKCLFICIKRVSHFLEAKLQGWAFFGLKDFKLFYQCKKAICLNDFFLFCSAILVFFCCF